MDLETDARKRTGQVLLLIFFCLIVLTGSFYFSRTYLSVRPIKGSSMEPTIHNDDVVFIFRTRKVRYDDIIVFEETGGAERILIKRVIGLPGDRIDIKYSEEDEAYHVYRNGAKLSEEHINEKMNFSYLNGKTLSVEIPEGKLFYLGDNRMDSDDSHCEDALADIGKIEGRAFMRYKKLRVKFLTKEQRREANLPSTSFNLFPGFQFRADDYERYIG